MNVRATLALLVVLAAGCSDEPAPDDSAVGHVAPPVPVAVDSGPKACDLISDAALDSIVGVDLEPARTTNDYMGDSSCKWDLPGEPQRGVKIALHAHGDIENYRRVPGAETVTGLGDAAVWHPTYGQMAVLTGEAVLSVSLLVESPERAPTEAIARAALARL